MTRVPKSTTKVILLSGVLFALGVRCAEAYPTLADAYAAMGFDPSVPGNATVVFFSDLHMCRDVNVLLTPFPTTTLHPELINIVNAMQPPAAKILCAGDTCTSYSSVPGWITQDDSAALRTVLEMGDFQAALAGFTNVAATNILWVPGNHDQTCLETNAEMFRSMYTNMPPYQAFDLAGIHFLLLNSGNYSEPVGSERQWLQAQADALSPTQTVAVVEHYPAFCLPALYRGMGVMLRDVFANWQTRWWVFSGHIHCASSGVYNLYNVGLNHVGELVVGSENTNMFGIPHDHGFEFLCLSNGVAGVIYYHFDTASFDVVYSLDNDAIQETPYPSWASPTPFVAQFEDCPGLLWRRNKEPDPVPQLTLVSNSVTGLTYLTPLATSEPEILMVSNTVNSLEWFAYPGEIRFKLQLGLHHNQATHFVIGIAGMSAFAAVSFSADYTNWVPVPIDPWLGGTYVSIPIPPDIAGLPVAYARFCSPITDGANNFIGGWGLSTTNAPPLVTYPQLAAVPNQQVVAGQPLTFAVVATDPYAPPDVLTFNLANGPIGAAIDPQSGVFSWTPPVDTPPGTISLSVQVADHGTPRMSATQQVLVTVLQSGIPTLSIAGWRQGCPVLSVSGNPGMNHTILASSDLLDWAVLCTTNLPTPFEFTDTQSAGTSPRFYKVRASP